FSILSFVSYSLLYRSSDVFFSEIHLDYLQQHKRRGCEVVGRAGTLLWESEGKNPEHCRVRLFLKDKNNSELLYENVAEPVNDARSEEHTSELQSRENI